MLWHMMHAHANAEQSEGTCLVNEHLRHTRGELRLLGGLDKEANTSSAERYDAPTVHAMAPSIG